MKLAVVKNGSSEPLQIINAKNWPEVWAKIDKFYQEHEGYQLIKE